MKRIFRYVSLVLITILSITMIVFKNQISVFALTMDLADVRVGDIFKSGDVLLFTRKLTDKDYFGTGTLSLSNASIAYFDSDNRLIDADSYSLHDYQQSDNTVDPPIIRTVNNNKYWYLDKIYYNSSGTFDFNLKPYEYLEPEYLLTCNKNEIGINETSICSFSVKYYSKLDSISFSLASIYNVSDFSLGESFDNLSFEQNESDEFNVLNFRASAKENIPVNENGYESTLLTFKITANKNEIINFEDNVVVFDLEYSDATFSGVSDIDEVSTTVIQKPVPTISDDVIATGSDDRPDSNPKTGNANFMIIYSFVVLFVSLSIFFVVYRYENTEL